ncbi:MAG TPA: DUF4350 domain-containing protein [Burkholderiales bacterium]|nr:DUF4350 domain-containing protein [Burkholderiales bacterium]
MSRPALTTALLAALVLGGAWWFFTNFERVPERQWTGYQGEARRNAFLAAERLLARMGASVRHAKTPGELRELPPNGTLILPDRRDAVAPDERRRLLAWIEAGGHLIVEDENYRVPDPLLDALGVKRKPTQPPGGEGLLEVELPHAPAPMKVRMHAQQSLEAPQARLSIRGKAATHLVHFPRGRGQITVLNDLAFMRNGAIGANDHAEFLWQLVRFQPDTAAVFVFDNPEKLSLARWLLDNAWAAIAAAAGVLALWLWHIAPRFGPLAPDPEPARRRLLDHLRASGRFQWSTGGAATLAESAREAALRRVARAQADFAGLGGREREERLNRTFGLTAEEARRVLRPAQNLAIHEFVTGMRVFQRIHERLSSRAQGERKR